MFFFHGPYWIVYHKLFENLFKLPDFALFRWTLLFRSFYTPLLISSLFVAHFFFDSRLGKFISLQHLFWFFEINSNNFSNFYPSSSSIVIYPFTRCFFIYQIFSPNRSILFSSSISLCFYSPPLRLPPPVPRASLYLLVSPRTSNAIHRTDHEEARSSSFSSVSTRLIARSRTTGIELLAVGAPRLSRTRSFIPSPDY